MTVADLIARLQALDPDLPVVVPTYETGDVTEAAQVGVDTVAVIEGNMSLAYADEDGAKPVVRLIGQSSATAETAALPRRSASSAL